MLELDSAGDPLVVHVGAVARGRGQLADADVVAFVAGRGGRGRVFEALGGVEVAGELGGGPRVVGESMQVVGRHVERPGGGGELVERPAGPAALDHRDRLAGVDGLGGELLLGDAAQGAGVAQAAA